MLLNKKNIFLCFLLPTLLFAQKNQEADSIKKFDHSLTEVVITGQFNPQSIKKSVFNVRVITSQDIQNLAANNLADVLNQYLNITVKPSGNDGRSTVSMFGLDAQYFKILIDNVPLVNEAGLGNNTDLSQINLNDIEQIEIIEGSMGVTYGANAVSGVLNIITKKSSQYKWAIMAAVQEETVGDEFSLFDEGRHIQTLKVSHNFSQKIYASVGINRNDFQGYLADKQGEDYTENDGLRGYNWLPKDQLNATALIYYKAKNFNLSYKFEYLDEDVDYYNSTVQSGYNATLGSYRYTFDKRYFTSRNFHNLNAMGKLFSQLNYNVSFSHQMQEREVEDYKYFLSSQTESSNVTVKDQSMEVFYSMGTVSNFFADTRFNMQLGYEFVNNLGFSLVQEANNIYVPVSERIENYDFFASAELKASERFSIRPGFRYSIQTLFENQNASSLGLRYLFDKGLEARGSVGSSFRTPTFQELYSKMIFDGHFFIGNENLIPETSTSFEASIKKQTYFNAGIQLSNMITSSYLNVNDRIDMALVGFNEVTGSPEYQYINISKYKMWNVSAVNQLTKDKLTVNVGAAIIGVSQKIDNKIFTSSDEFLYSFNFNLSASYTIPKWKTIISGYYKYNGTSQQFVESTNEYVISELDPSNCFDASARKNFFKDQFEVTVGARNIFDIKNISQSRTSQTGGHATSNEVLMAYGRSYFIKLTFNLNI